LAIYIFRFLADRTAICRPNRQYDRLWAIGMLLSSVCLLRCIVALKSRCRGL